MNAVTPVKAGEIMEAVIARGDLAQLSPDERAKYYVRVCESVGLNPMTQPFQYITLNGKLTLYARKDCTDQLRAIHKVSVTDLAESERDGVFIVTAKVINGEGRSDASKGAVALGGLKGEALANALMKAETKAKRRATLSICGLGFLDETEIEDVPEVRAQRAKSPLKKDTREPFWELQRELWGLKTAKDIVDWCGTHVRSRVEALHPDFADTLRKEWALRVRDPAAPRPHPAEEIEKQVFGEAATEVVDPQTGEITERVVWTETEARPATAADAKEVVPPAATKSPVDATPRPAQSPAGADPLDIPPGLKRTKATDEAAWLDRLTKAIAEAKDEDALIAIQKKEMAENNHRKMSASTWEKAVDAFRRRMEELLADPPFDAEQWLKGDLAGALSGAETRQELSEVKDKILLAEKDKLTPDQWKRAVKAYRDRLDEIDPQNMLAGG